MEMTWAVLGWPRPYLPLQHLLCSLIPQTWSETAIQVVLFCYVGIHHPSDVENWSCGYTDSATDLMDLRNEYCPQPRD
jgi:hypothetical protein